MPKLDDTTYSERHVAALRTGCAARGAPFQCPKCSEAHALLWDCAGHAWLLCLHCQVARTPQGDTPVYARYRRVAAGQHEGVSWLYELHVSERRPKTPKTRRTR